MTQRKAAEEALKKSERHYSQLLAQSERLQEQLRQLSRQILSAQEDERKRISRELHDVIAQTLTGINLRLATLKKEAAVNIKGWTATSRGPSGWSKNRWTSCISLRGNCAPPCSMIWG